MGKYDDANDVAIRLKNIYKAEQKLKTLRTLGIGTPGEIERLEGLVKEKDEVERTFHNLHKDLFYRLARKYQKESEIDDLIQEQYSHVKELLLSYDETKGVKFVTYLTSSLSDRLYDYSHADSIYHPDRYTLNSYTKLEKARKELQAKGIENPSDEEVADYCGWSQERLSAYKEAIRTGGIPGAISLDEVVTTDSDDGELEREIASDFSLEDEIVKEIVSKSTREILSEILTAEEYMLISEKYGINELGVRVRPMDTMARMGWSSNTYSNILKRAKKKLQGDKRLRGFYDT